MSLPDGPRANIEVKARLLDLDAALRTAETIGARAAGADRQVDTYYRVPRGRLKLRQSLFSGEQLIVYLRSDDDGPRRSDYEVLPVPHGGRTRELLDAVLGIEVVVEKLRRVFLLRDTRIHLDTVKGLRDFIEFEAVFPHGRTEAEAAAREEVDRLVRAFRIPATEFVRHSYRELLLG